MPARDWMLSQMMPTGGDDRVLVKPGHAQPAQLEQAVAGYDRRKFVAHHGEGGWKPRPPLRELSSRLRWLVLLDDRVEVVLGLMHWPEVLFLDEPTTGLDPQNRSNLWDQLRRLKDGGTTIFLTTHYLDEADQLSDRLAIIDHGRIVTAGRPQELKHRFATGTVSITPRTGVADLEELERDLSQEPFVSDSRVEGELIRLYVSDATQGLARIVERLRARGIELRAVSLAEPSLDDVFLHETGRSLRDTGEPVGKEAA